MRNAIAALLRRVADRIDGRWKGLPESPQAVAAAQSLQLRAWSCATTIRIARLIGTREASYNTASGVLIEFPKRAVIATAWHVLDEFRRSRDAGQNVALICDNLGIEKPRTVYRDEPNDIAFIHVPPEGHQWINAVPYRPKGLWPAPRVKVGDTVHLCGFPKRFRHDGDEILHGDLNLLVDVASSAETHFMLNIDWKQLGHVGRTRVPSRQVNYGGVSGGPVFLADGGANPLVGIVSEAGDTFPLWRIAALANIDEDLESSPSEAL